jgi:hypothetical protein
VYAALQISVTKLLDLNFFIDLGNNQVMKPVEFGGIFSLRRVQRFNVLIVTIRPQYA